MDLEALKKELGKNGGMRAAANSPEARRVLKNVDAAALERAAKSGDTAAMQRYLAQLLQTPEGKALAEKVRKAVGGNG